MDLTLDFGHVGEKTGFNETFLNLCIWFDHAKEILYCTLSRVPQEVYHAQDDGAVMKAASTLSRLFVILPGPIVVRVKNTEENKLNIIGVLFDP
jgi:hypothetical protein